MEIVIGLILGGFVAYAAGTSYSSDQILYNKNSEQHVLTAVINDIYDKLNYGDATAGQIAAGQTALVKGKKVTGTGKIEGGPGIVMALEANYGRDARTVDVESYITNNNVQQGGTIETPNSSLLDCHTLTVDNFLLRGAGLQGTADSISVPTMTYNQSTCMLSIPKSNNSGIFMNCRAYLVVANNTPETGFFVKIADKIGSGYNDSIGYWIKNESSSSYTIDVKTFIEENNLDLDYTKLTDANFIISGISANISNNSNGEIIYLSRPISTYDATTGKLKLSKPALAGAKPVCSLKFNVYLLKVYRRDVTIVYNGQSGFVD